LPGEVQHLGIAAVGDEDVGGLDVAVNDALGVGRAEASAIWIARSSRSVVSRAPWAMRCFSV